jgi:hypothetical protein
MATIMSYQQIVAQVTSHQQHVFVSMNIDGFFIQMRRIPSKGSKERLNP